MEDGSTDSNPPMPDKEIFQRWVNEYPGEQKSLADEIRKRGRGWLDSYALEDIAEFFAVADCATNDPSQYVASALVPGQDPVND